MDAISKLRDFLKFLGSVQGDLANITSPPFFLAPFSVTEVGSCWVERPSVFAAPALEPDAERRSLLILKWILVTLRSQFYIGCSDSVGSGAGNKKPLNAFLGEIFRAQWHDDVCTSRFVAEQVSHHPPITAVYMWDEEHGIRGEGYTRVGMTFSGSVDIRQIGHAVVHIDRYDEDYLIPLPDCSVRGFLSGRLYPELSGTYRIISSSGFVSEIAFSGTSLLGRGLRNGFKAIMYRQDDPQKTPLYVVSGVWSEKFTFYKGGTDEVVVDVWDHALSENRPVEARCESIQDQDCWESRRAWHAVIAALKAGNYSDTVVEKAKLEKAQRVMRAHEARENTTWKPLLFAPMDTEYELFHRLTSGTGWELQDDKTKGVWKVDRRKVAALSTPFRSGVTPLGPAL